MGISSEKLLSLGQLFNQAGTMYAAPGSSQAAFNDKMNDTFNAQQQAVALRKQKEAEEKKRKSGLFGSIGSTLGTIAGVALAPVTGGASLAIPALAGAAGGAIGGTVGNLVGGGGFNPQQTLMYGAQGAMGGLGAGMFAPKVVGSAGTYTGAMKNGLFDPIGKFTPAAAPAASGGLFSRIATNPNVQGYMRSQTMPMQGLSSMFQNTPNGFYMNKSNMSHDLLFRNPRYHNGVEY
jgi:hypothetical protein